MNILKAMKLNHYTEAGVHTEYQLSFTAICRSREISGYVVPAGTVEVTCPTCRKINKQ